MINDDDDNIIYDFYELLYVSLVWQRQMQDGLRLVKGKLGKLWSRGA